MAKTKPEPTKREWQQIDAVVSHFRSEAHRFSSFAKILHDQILARPDLKSYVHFAKYRIKEPDHLRGKLARKLLSCKAKGIRYEITTENLFLNVQDLAGVRILHLHTQQMAHIDPLLKEMFNDEKFKVLEGPIANLWDHEYEKFFEGIGIPTKVRSDSMYTSVHYVVQANNTFQTTCELQVRTLSEELWGEVSHTINYPEETDSIACQEQLKVLARLTSTATRLVDSIFKSHEDHGQRKSSTITVSRSRKKGPPKR